MELKDIRFQYKNYRGETAIRHVRPKGIRFGVNEFHAGPRWLLLGFCLDRMAMREFALDDCRFDITEEPKEGATL